MTNQEFREWLKGFFELSGEGARLDLKQMQVIVNHLNLAEAVEGKLDDVNRQMRDELKSFIAKPSDFDALTSSIRQQILG